MSAPADYEKLGAFYLGRPWDPASEQPTGGPLLYDGRHLTTHAFCVGMTGSGKTGLCLSLLEEAALDGVPAICIDPKGDLGNLLLTFPELRPADFAPWIDPGEAARKGQSIEQRAGEVAALWKSGLGAWGQDGARIGRFRDAVDLAIYTPGSQAGLPLAVLGSLGAPPPGLDAESLAEKVAAAVGGLLTLLGVEADPVQSREHVFLSNLFHHAWSRGQSLDLGGLVRAILEPPLQRVGVLDLETFFPAKDRQALALRLNGLLASPGFSSWLEGEPLDVQRLLWTAEGKPRLSVLSIAHLSEAERQFFVTLLLEEVIAWMRAQPGTTSLRALLYMDEVFGFLPPVKEPPTKRLFLTMLKQARAYGVGTVLATQNPVDVDYKALSNCGTWLLGRLQTERDVDRVMDGLAGAAAAAGTTFDAGATRRTLAGLRSRVFLMNDVHEEAPVLFHTRWAMSYLRGPLTRQQIGQLMAERKAGADAAPSPGGLGAGAATPGAGGVAGAGVAGAGVAGAGVGASAAGTAAGAAVSGAAVAGAMGAAVAGAHAPAQPAVTGGAPAGPPLPEGASRERPIVAEEIEELFVGEPVGDFVYRPGLLADVRLHYVKARADIDAWFDQRWLAPLAPDQTPAALWEGARWLDPNQVVLRAEPLPAAGWLPVPSGALGKGPLRSIGAQLKRHLHATGAMGLGECKALKLHSQVGESYDQFVARVRQAHREARDVARSKLEADWAKKIQRAEQQLERAKDRLAREKGQASRSKLDAALTVGTALTSLFGGGSISGKARRVATVGRRASRAAEQGSDVERAEAKVQDAEEELADLQIASHEEVEALGREMAEPPPITEVRLAPRKSDIDVKRLALAWFPQAV